MKNIEEIIRSTEFFRGISDKDIGLLAAKINLFAFQKDEVIINKGDKADAMYIILSGDIKIHDGEFVVAKLGGGSFFGEMALLDASVRSMSATALDNVELISIQREVFFELFTGQTGIAQKIISTIIKRLRQQDEIMITQLKSREEQLTRLVEIKTEGLSKKNEELAEALAQVKTAQEQLVQREKLASLGQLTAGIAHEIKNPLNFVSNFSEVSVEMLNELKESESEEDKNEIIASLQLNLAKISEHARRVDSIVKSMLDHSRSSTGRKQPTDINQLCNEFFNLAFHGMRANNPDFNCILEKHFDDQLPDVNLLPQEMSRVLLNLFNNSFYAVYEKEKKISKLTTEILSNANNNNHPEKYKPVVLLATHFSNNPGKKNGGEAVITVRDNGNGIPDEIREKIFEPFFTTKPAGQGTGLGLSISYDIIKAHGGSMSIHSKENEFTEFIITLPL